MKTIPASSRTARFDYAIRNVVKHATRLEASGRVVRYLNIGDPALYGFRPPPEIVEAVVRAMRDGKNGYTASEGVPAARDAIARDLTRRGAPTRPGDVVIGAGASEAADLLLTALVEPGDEVLTPVPQYPLYGAILSKLGARERAYHLDESQGWCPDPDEIASLLTPRTKAFVLIHPSNPTGAIHTPAQLEALFAVLEGRDIVLVAEEVYSQLAFDGPVAPLASMAGERLPIVTLDSFSKSFLVPGWRVGWLAFGAHPAFGPEIRGAVSKLAQGRLCSAGPAQFAVPAGLDGPRTHFEPLVARLRRQTLHASDRLNAIPGVTCVPARGAFYLMPRVELPAGHTDESFVLSLLEATGNLVVHGSGFGTSPERGFFRLVTLPEVAELDAVLDDLARFVGNLRG